jgi:hypothetical protein
MIRHARHASPQRLQNKAHNITRNKHPRIRLRLDSRILRTESHYDVSKTEVDASRHKTRRNGEADDLQEEAGFVPRVGVGEDAAEVAEDLEGAAGG